MSGYLPLRRFGSLLIVMSAVLGLGALGATEAHAAYEQAKEGSEFVHFGGEAEELQNALAISVNESTGSLYVVGRNARVLRFSSGKEGEAPMFQEAWGWGVGNSAEEYQRCGPAYAGKADPALQHTFEACTSPNSNAPFGPDEASFSYGHFNTPGGVAVDSVTGDVYVRNEPKEGIRERNLIEVFTATGTGIAHFGEAGRTSPAPAESIAEGPSRLHAIGGSAINLAITVDEGGTVYLTDSDFQGIANPPGVERVMCFKPQTPGDYEDYEYCGREHDIAVSTAVTKGIIRLGLVGADRLVTASQEFVREYAFDRVSGESSLICSLPVSGQLTAMATNSDTGEVFYFTFSGKKIHRLGPCNESIGKFEDPEEAVALAPEAKNLFALAINPSLTWGEQRPAGVLYAASPGSTSQPGIGDVVIPAKVGPPSVSSESVAHTTSTSSALRAEIDPHGVATGFYFEYLSEAEYSAHGERFEGPNLHRAPLSPGQIGVAGVATAVVSGLAPDTEYRFRAVATRCKATHEPACEASGEAAAFHTYPSTGAAPSDGRVYELVSPAEKHGGEAFPAAENVGSCRDCKPPGSDPSVVFPMQSTPDGNAVSYMGYAFSPTEGAAVFNSYVSRRTAAGWRTTAVSPSLLATKRGEDMAFDDGLDEGMIGQTTGSDPQLAAEAPTGYPNLYLQDTVDPTALTALLTNRLFGELEKHNGRPYRSGPALTLQYAGHSSDFSTQLFSANDSLTDATPYAPEPEDPGQAGSDLYAWSGGRLSLVNVLPGNATAAVGAAFASASPDTHAISVDGRRVYWHVGPIVYVREDGQITREVKHSGSFVTASPDGLQVLLSDGCLYSLLTESCTDLTQGQGGFQGIAGQSGDLSSIYFIDTAALAGSGKNGRLEEAHAGEDNLYLYQAGQEARFIATLASSDEAGGATKLADWAAGPGERTAEASPDGVYLAFGSTKRLTGYDNMGLCNENLNGELAEEACTEVFLYDSETRRLTCPSCNPTGEVPLGNSTLRRVEFAPGWQAQPRYLINSGRLFFDSGDRLSPLDTNGRVEDVYEFEPEAVGSCARAGGCVLLISSGTGSTDSNFLATDETGANVFFTTRQRLMPSDTDDLIDLYDAREDGGFPSEAEIANSECRGETCQSAAVPPSAPNLATPTFQGSGNVKAERPGHCPKGKVKRNGKCVKKKAKKHQKETKKRRPRAAGVKRGGEE